MNPRAFAVMTRSPVSWAGWRGWISPSGEYVAIQSGADHNEPADALLRKHYKGWKWEENPQFNEGGASYAALALQARGWIRVVAPTILSCSVLNGATARSICQLWDDHDVDRNETVQIDLAGTRFSNGDTVQTVIDYLENAGLI